jgi:hypothetical protein
MPENAYDRARERGPSVDVPTHRVTASMIYQLPFGNGRRFLSNSNRVVDSALGGWELGVVTLDQTGQFLTPYWTGPDPTGTAYTDSLTPATVQIRPNVYGNPNLPSDQRSVARWFDPSVFGAPTPGSFGSAGKGIVIGPGSSVWHVSLAKYITIGERVRVRPEMTAFNVFNHPNWANPNMNIRSSPGVIRNVVGRNDLDSIGPRNLRASLRVEW